MHEEALGDFTQCITLNPKHAHAYNNRSRSLSLTHTHILSLTHTHTFTHSGNVHDNLNSLDLALIDYSHAISLDKYCAVFYRNRADVRKRKGLVKKAARDALVGSLTHR